MTSIDFKNKIPDYVTKVANRLIENGYEAYLVGGSIRDIITGKTPDDFDIATNAYPEQITKIFDKSIPTGAKFGTITVISEDAHGEKFDVEVTTYRSEADYVGGRWPSRVEFARSIDEDLSRRDFTINAIALNLDESNNFQIVDPFNGLEDINNKIIRAVGNPIDRFEEDGLRAVRACRLASQLNFTIEQATFDAIKQTLHVTKLVSIERFRDELLKLLYKSPKPSVGLRLLKESGILQLFIPELLEGVDVTQPEFHSNDVFEHSILTVDEAEDSIKLAALFHDIGKPRTISKDEKGTHFYGHDIAGAEITKEVMKRLKFPNIEIDRTVKLVRWHMFYYPSADWRKSEEEAKGAEHGWTDGAIRRLIQNVGGEEAIDDLLKLRIADQLSNKKYQFDQEELDAITRRIADVRAKEMALKISDLDITGNDLIENFDIPAGPIVGQTLKFLLEKVIDEPGLNKKVDLLILAKEYLTKNNFLTSH
ncbi:HD domain-containing protein [Candidatus Dojkabacteria bacterium]|nr:HD domain-containing protein [Candidatus Dojkabacteria bacterium]